MLKIIFVTVLATTSIASACKISRSGMSLSIINGISNDAFKNIATSSAIKAVYTDSIDNIYIAEILNEKNECSTLLYDAKFDSLNCKVQVTPITTLIAVPCR